LTALLNRENYRQLYKKLHQQVF